MTPIGEALVLTADLDRFRDPAPIGVEARLLPSGDAASLWWGDQRDLLVHDPARRAELWTSRVWPGAVLVDGEIVGTWRRKLGTVSISPWTTLDRRARERLGTEAGSMPLPGVDEVNVVWDDA